MMADTGKPKYDYQRPDGTIRATGFTLQTMSDQAIRAHALECAVRVHEPGQDSSFVLLRAHDYEAYIRDGVT